MVPDLEAWEAWHPRVVADRLSGVDVPWCVAAGWALDLFRGAPTRAHEDVEIAVPAARYEAVAERFGDCEFYAVCDGEVWPVSDDTLRGGYQTWARDKATGKWRLDIFREPHDGDVWVCRRDSRIRRPYPEIIEFTSDGIPYLIPEIVLLFKAKDRRDKDEADFAGVVPVLDVGRRDWLDDALGLIHPAHPWRARLRG